MKRMIENLAIMRSIRSLAEMTIKERTHLLKQMKNYLNNCELEDVRLHSLKERVNRS